MPRGRPKLYPRRCSRCKTTENLDKRDCYCVPCRRSIQNEWARNRRALIRQLLQTQEL